MNRQVRRLHNRQTRFFAVTATTGGQERHAQHQRPPAPLHPAQEQLDEDLHPAGAALEAAGQDEPAQARRGDQGVHTRKKGTRVRDTPRSAGSFCVPRWSGRALSCLALVLHALASKAKIAQCADGRNELFLYQLPQGSA